jgi:hypothetical protein
MRDLAELAWRRVVVEFRPNETPATFVTHRGILELIDANTIRVAPGPEEAGTRFDESVTIAVNEIVHIETIDHIDNPRPTCTTCGAALQLSAIPCSNERCACRLTALRSTGSPYAPGHGAHACTIVGSSDTRPPRPSYTD